MTSLAPARIAPWHRVDRPVLIAILCSIVLLAALPLAAWSGDTGSHVAVSPVPVAPARPLLILRPQTSPITGSLTGGGSVRGTLSPSLPGANTVRIAVRLPSGKQPMVDNLVLTASMPGMIMSPVTGVLRARGDGYTGTLVLPMLGDYLAVLVLHSPAGRVTATITLHLPLPRA